MIEGKVKIPYALVIHLTQDYRPYFAQHFITAMTEEYIIIQYFLGHDLYITKRDDDSLSYGLPGEDVIIIRANLIDQPERLKVYDNIINAAQYGGAAAEMTLEHLANTLE